MATAVSKSVSSGQLVEFTDSLSTGELPSQLSFRFVSPHIACTKFTSVGLCNFVYHSQSVHPDMLSILTLILLLSM